MGRQTLALVLQLDAAVHAADDLAEAAAEAVAERPGCRDPPSFPGSGRSPAPGYWGRSAMTAPGWRGARGLKSYAGSAPVTVASGKSRVVRHRKVKNQRLAAAGYVWVFRRATLTPGQGYTTTAVVRRGTQAAAMRNVFNRLLGCLYHCLRTGQAFDPGKAFPALRLPIPNLSRLDS